MQGSIGMDTDVIAIAEASKVEWFERITLGVADRSVDFSFDHSRIEIVFRAQWS